MQRLFSTFPASAPGAGLLLLRLLVAAQLLWHGLYGESDAAHIVSITIRAATVALGGMLLLGAWTPLVTPLLGVLEVLVAWRSGNWELHGTRVAILLSLTALGPGAWSIDARRYGRKLISL